MTIRRREFLTGTAATGLLGPLAGRSFAQASKSGTVRVWGEPGPYGGVAVAAMNEWAQKNAPGTEVRDRDHSLGRRLREADDGPRRAPAAGAHQRRVAPRHAADGRGAPRAAGRRRRQGRPGSPGARRQVGLLGRLERQAVRHPGPPSASPPSGPHRHHPGARAVRSGHLDLDRSRQRGAHDQPEEARHGRHLPGARPQPLHRLPLRRPASSGRRAHVRAGEQVRGGVRQRGDRRGAGVRSRAAPVHAEGRGRIQLPPGRRRARHGAHGHELLLGPHPRSRGRGGKAGVRGDGGLQPRPPSEDRPPLELERLPGLDHPGAEQPVHRRGEAGADVPADQQGVAGEVLPLADAECGSGLQGRRGLARS